MCMRHEEGGGLMDDIFILCVCIFDAIFSLFLTSHSHQVDSVNFVYMEAVKMISSDVFSEKQVGYLGVSVLLNEVG